MEGITGIFHYQCFSRLKHENRSRLIGIDRAQPLSGGLILRANNSEGRCFEVTNCCSFSEKFWVGAQIEHSRCCRVKYPVAVVEDRRQHAAANDDDLLLSEFQKGDCNLLASTKQMCRIDLSIGATGGGHCHKAQLRLAQCLFDIDGAA